MDVLRISGIKVYAYHGCIPEEAKVGGYFTVNTAFFGTFAEAAEKDDLNLAIDYVTVSKLVNEQMSTSNKLIETVAYRILKKLKNAFQIAEEVEVTIIKHKAPIEMPVNEVSFTVKG